MENKALKFKTNINCGGCVSSVKPHLDNTKGIHQWTVDTTDKDKILTVKSDELSEEQIIEIVQKAGFKIHAL